MLPISPIRSCLLPILSILGFVASPSPVGAETLDNATKVLMQEKLRDAQALLGAVSTDDFTAMARSAQHLVELSNHTNWHSRQTPEYDLFLNGFRRNASVLAKAAEDHNADAASLAYVQLTLTCFSCHKYMRVPAVAALQKLDLSPLASAPAK